MEGIPLPGEILLPGQGGLDDIAAEEDLPPGDIPLPRDSRSTEKDVHVLFQPPNHRDIVPPPPTVSFKFINHCTVLNCCNFTHITAAACVHPRAGRPGP